MKKNLLFIITIILSYLGYSQTNSTINYFDEYSFLMDSSKNRIGYGCGWAGISTENLFSIRKLIKGKQFVLVQKLLYSTIPSTNYLAVATLIYADKKKIFKLDSITKVRIDYLRTSESRIPYCTGCFGGGDGEIGGLFKNKKFDFLTIKVKYWIEESFKRKNK